MPSVRQTSFASGELAPLLWGRSDLPIYGSGLRRMRDFFISRHGAAVSRPGTTWVNLTATNGAARLVPFIFSDTVSYVVEFGANVIRFHTNGGTVLSGGVPYAIPTPYALDDLPRLRWVQSGNVLTITCPSHPPRELTRVGATNWTLTDVDFSRPAPGCAPTLQTPLASSPDEPDQHPAREWTYVVTEVRRDDRGVVTESTPVTITTDDTGAALPDRLVVYPDTSQTLLMNPTGSITDPHFIGFVVYRGRGGMFGLIGQTNTNTFTDVGADPDYSRAPPQGRDPFKVVDSTGVLIRTERPTAVAYFEERRVYGGTAERPGFVFFSATGDYTNFDERMVPVADEALMYELAARRKEEVRHLLGLQRLLVFTSASVWSFGGSGGEALAADVLPEVRVQADIGCMHVPPLSIEGMALYLRTKGIGVRGLMYDINRDGFAGMDLSTRAQHFFSPQGLTLSPYAFGTPASAAEIVSWTYAEDPWGLVWAVRADGALLSLTLVDDGNGYSWGWAQHNTDGYVLDVCAVPEGDEDAVYLVTSRAIFGSSAAFSIERMTSRIPRGTTDDDVCVDCAFKYSGPPVTTLTGLNAFAGRKDIYVIGQGNPPRGPYPVSAAGELVLEELPTANDGANVVLWVGLLYQPELETLDAAPGSARGQQKTTKEVLFEVDQSKGIEAGQDLDHLKPWRQRSTADGYGIVSAATELVRVTAKGTWDTGARAALRQTLPLPVTVVGLTREIDVGG
jgi:hypothetical protein